jgi:ferredoxin
VVAEAPAEPAAASGGPSVEFQSDDYPASWEVPDGKTVLQSFMDQGGTQDEPLGWECKKGVCGLCAVQIVEGADQFAPVDEGSTELKTIQIAVGVEPDPTKYRLACLSKIKGPVKLCVPE